MSDDTLLTDLFTLSAGLGIAKEAAVNLASLYGSYFKALLAEEFTREEALAICLKWIEVSQRRDGT